jgi:hypothetical protein
MQKHSKSSSKYEKLRKPLSRVLAIIFILFAFLTAPKGNGNQFHEILEFTGYSLLILAALGRIWCLIYISGRKDRELCTEGPLLLMSQPTLSIFLYWRDRVFRRTSKYLALLDRLLPLPRLLQRRHQKRRNQTEAIIRSFMPHLLSVNSSLFPEMATPQHAAVADRCA